MNDATLIPTETFIPYTRIKRISERKRLPIVGKIRLGVRVNGKNGMYSQETPYFIVPPEVAAKYGNKPTELDIIFMLDDEIRMFPQALRMYGASGLKCIGNGEQAFRLNEETFRFQPFPHCPCDHLISRDCNKRAHLLVMIPSVSNGGLYQINTGSQDSINNINGYFEFLKLTLNRIANIPLKLRRVPHLSPWKGQMKTHYPLVLRYEGSTELTEQLKQETTEVLATLSTLDVQNPIDINPAIDPDATIVAEEDLESIMTGPPSTPEGLPESAVTPQSVEPFAGTPVKEEKPAQLMTDRQQTYLLQLAERKGISPTHVKAITQGYNKRQASGLIEQLERGDYSGLEEISEDEIPLAGTIDIHPQLPNTPHDETVEF